MVLLGAHEQAYNHGQKSWDTFPFPGCFSIHTGPTPPLIPQTMLDRVSRIFSEIQLCIGWGEGELHENFENDAVLRGSREMTENMHIAVLSQGLLSRIVVVLCTYIMKF